MSPALPSPNDKFVARCTILAGPNGSGKSSVYAKIQPPGEFINADEIARRIDAANPEAVSIRAGREVVARLRSLLTARRDFTYETTLSSHQSLALMRDARRAGFEISLVFVILADADLNVQRVADRVRRGGHSIPEQTIRRRHREAFERLAEAIPIAHASLIYDNTSKAPDLLVRIDAMALVESRLDANALQHVRVAQAVAAATGINIDDVLGLSSRN